MKGFPAHASAARTVDSQVGKLVLLASEKGLSGLFFHHRLEDNIPPPNNPKNDYLNDAEQQLEEYFEGDRKNFAVRFDVAGTPFQKMVWNELSQIPFGETCSYGTVAERMGNPKSVRAVGLANGSNPISIIVPCHRVIGANGSLTGFGGGLEKKRELLVHEGVLLDVV